MADPAPTPSDPYADELRRQWEENVGLILRAPQVATIEGTLRDRYARIAELEKEIRILRELLDTVVAERDQAKAQAEGLTLEVAQLKARVAELERIIEEDGGSPPPAPPPAPPPEPVPRPNIWTDHFRVLPTEGPDRYILNAPPARLALEGNRLLVTSVAGDPAGTVRSDLGLWGPDPAQRAFHKDPIGSERFYSLGVQIPEDWWPSGHKTILAYWNSEPDPGERNREPCLSLYVVNLVLKLVQLWSDKPLQPGNENRRTIWEMPVERGKLLKFLFNVHWSWKTGADADGFLRVLLNGGTIVQQLGEPNCYNDDTGGLVFRFGIYWPGAADSQLILPGTRREVLCSHVEVGDERNREGDFTR